LLNFLLPDIFSSAEQFDEWFDLEVDDEEAKKNMISQLHKILRPFMLRRLKADVAKGLPPKTETILMVGMSSMQKKLYKQLLLRDLDSITGKVSGKNRTAVLNIVMQLRKCCGHPYLFEGMEDRTLDPLGEHLVDNCGKLSMTDKLLKRLKERGSRVLIFTQMTRVLDILEDFMIMRGYQYCRIDGNTTYEDRESGIDNFNAEGSEKFCFLLSTRAGGLGINLQTADTCLLYGELRPHLCCYWMSFIKGNRHNSHYSCSRLGLEPTAGSTGPGQMPSSGSKETCECFSSCVGKFG
jgi:SWI/SNF-related matrix-associated actin-dependent regulator of chromatin subfamily A member 5